MNATSEHRFVRVEILVGGVLVHCPDPRIVASAPDLIRALQESTLVSPENPDAPSMLRVTTLPGGLRVRFRDQNGGDRDFLLPDGDLSAGVRLWDVVRDVSARQLGARVREVEQLGFDGDPDEVVQVQLGPLSGEVRREDIRTGSHIVRGVFGFLRRVGVSAADRRIIAEGKKGPRRP